MRIDKEKWRWENAGLLAVALSVILCGGLARAVEPVPVNAAEAVLENLWDPEAGGFASWTVGGDGSSGLSASQGWAWVGFQWTDATAGTPALRMQRAFSPGVGAGGFDRLIAGCSLPAGSSVEVRANGVPLGLQTAVSGKKEYVFDLPGGTATITSLEFLVTPSQTGAASGWVRWFLLQDSALLGEVTGAWAGADPDWPGLLTTEVVPGFAPRHGLSVEAADLSTLASLVPALRAASSTGKSVFDQAADYVRGLASPEAQIHEFANTAGSQFARDRDAARYLVQNGVNAALAGHALRDAGLLRLAGRYALSLAACDVWDDGFLSTAPGGVWEPRAFVPALLAHDAALLLDLLGPDGAVLTSEGADFLRQRIAERGLGTLHFNFWKWNYLATTNQGLWFSPARVLACAVLERSADGVRYGTAGSPALAPHSAEARDYLDGAVADTLLADGGYGEGPVYFRTLGRDAALAYHYHARLRGVSQSSVLPAEMRATGTYAEVIASTVAGQDFIPYGDSANVTFEPFVPAFMAAVTPGSAWGRIMDKAAARAGAGGAALWPLTQAFSPNTLNSLNDVVVAWKLRNAAPGASAAAPLAHLPTTGLTSSTRTLADGRVAKLFVKGAIAGAIHNHEDTGHFVFEFGGQTFAADPRIGDYGSGANTLLQQAQVHNLLLPTGLPGGTRAKPDGGTVSTVDVAAHGPGGPGTTPTGTATAHDIRITPQPAWTTHFSSWSRTFVASGAGVDDDVLRITDTYSLKPGQGTGVEFLWHTNLPVVTGSNSDGRATATIGGNGAGLVLVAPAGATLEAAPVPNLTGPALSRIAIRATGTGGSLTVIVKRPSTGWRENYFTAEERANTAVSGDAADPDGDGINNFREYAFGTNPRAKNAGAGPRQTSATSGGAEYLAIAFERNRTAADLQFVVQSSGDLVTWTDIDPDGANRVSLADPSPTNPQTASYVVRDSVPMSGSTRRFLRLKVTGR